MCKLKTESDKMPLIIAPKYTRATFMTSMASDHLYEWLRLRGFSPIKIAGFRTRKPIVRKELALLKLQPKPCIIYYFGHGLDDCWIGMEDFRARFLKRCLIKLGANDRWLDQDAIIHTISCYTMNKLGPALVKGKVRCYMGSPKKMLINPIDNRIEPQTVPDFVDIFTIAQKYLAMGHTCGEALAVYKQRCTEILSAYERSGMLPKSKQMRNAYYGIKLNRDYYTAIGDLSSRWITPEELSKILEKSRVPI